MSQLTSVVTRRRIPFRSSQSITFSLPFTFSDVAKEQAVQPRGVITRAFFFTATTDTSFKRFMPGIARPSRQCRRDVTRRNYDTLICAFVMFNSNWNRGFPGRRLLFTLIEVLYV